MRTIYDINYDALPEHMRDGAKLYIERGIEPGSFLAAVLANDLVGAASRADHININALKAWAMWLYSDCPSQAWGSREKVAAWIETRRKAAHV